MFNFSITRFNDKVTNKPSSETFIKQVDLYFNFYASPKTGDRLFYIPRHTSNFDLLDSRYGTSIDFGVDWSKAELKVSNPIVSTTFFDELHSYVDEEAQNLFDFLKKLSQTHQVFQLSVIWRIVQFTMVRESQFFQREMLRQIHLSGVAAPIRPTKAKPAEMITSCI